MANGKMNIKEIFIPVIPLTEELHGKELRIIDHLNLTGSSPRNIGFIPITELYAPKPSNENSIEIKVAALLDGEVPSEEEKSLLIEQGIQAYSYALIPLALYYSAEAYTLSAKAYIPSLPKYFSLTGFHSGIKAPSKTNNLDMAVLFSEKPCSWAGTFTKNAMKAICVEHNIELKSKTVHGLIANSGNANCCTGEDGIKADNDLRKLLGNFIESIYKISSAGTIAEHANSSLQEQSLPVLSASTGVIGRKLELSHVKKIFTEKIEEKKNSKPYESVYDFARAIMTTDTVPKISQDQKQRFLGICKGSGMIAPNMATMLGFIITDVKISGLDNQKAAEFMQKILSEIVDATFNNISVDGDTSTNDMVLLLNNFTGEEISQEEFKSSLEEVCKGLCYQIIADGEGLTKIIDLKLENLPISPLNLQKIGRNIINSMLVKTAIFGNDPNWGRIVAAFAREEALLEGLDMSSIEVNLLGSCVFKNASAQLFGEDLNTLAKRLKQARHVEITISLTKYSSTTKNAEIQVMESSLTKKASNSAHFLGNDLSYDYIKINAEYTS
jgi:glutamate N-acetyltransferase / amino-acid N-acetyltransferase